MMEVIGKYKIKGEIGSGGMAQVYLAADLQLKRDVALKMIHKHLLKDTHAIKRFENEAHAIAQFSHQNIVRLFDYGHTAEGQQYLVIEYIDGKTVGEILAAQVRLPNLVLLDLLRQILCGLKAAHEKRIFHRDIKPSNIMIDRDGVVKIMDFGVAFLVDQGSLTMTGTFVGSPNYISPEQAEGSRSPSGKSDVFSAGALMYECAAGLCPFKGENVAATLYSLVHDEPVSLFKYNPQLLSGIGEIIQTCMIKDPSGRPDTAEAIRLIEQYSGLLGVVPGTNRVKKFIDNPNEYRKEEASELYGLCCKKARDFSRKGDLVHVLKFYSQARQFGALSAMDEQIIRRLKQQAVIRKALLHWALPLLVLVSITGTVMLYRMRLETPPGTAVRTAGVAQAPGLSAPRTDSAAVAGETVPDTGGVIEPTAPSARPDSTVDTAVATTARAQDSAINNRNPDTGSALNGYLELKILPPWTDIFVDGVYIGVFPRITMLPLAPGSHDLVLKNPQCRPFQETITVLRGDTLVRHVTLQRLN